MKLTSVEYSEDSNDWKTTDYIPTNSRYIIVYSPEFGTSIGYYAKKFVDKLREDETINILYWRELPRYVPS